MKKLLSIITILMVISSCSTTREAKSSRIELRKEKKLAQQFMVRKAVESRRFIVRFDRIYFSYGGIVNLVPRANFIIVDGETAIISTAYIGRQYNFRPIAGITMKGKTITYNLTEDSLKGKYELDMKVNSRTDSFDVYLTIGKDGSCNVSLSSIRINNARYSGHIVPIGEKKVSIPEKGEII